MVRSVRKRVLIIQSQIKQYRVPFYEKLYDALNRDGVELRVVYSDPHRWEAKKKDTFHLPLEFGRETRAYWFCGNRLLYQPAWAEVHAADLVIVEQANKYLMNYIILLSSVLGLKKMAFWGHGKNRGPRTNRISEWLKRRTVNWVDWWFAYTAGTADYLVECGVHPQRITNVQNAIDTAAFRSQLDGISDCELTDTKRALNLCGGAKIGLFCSGVTEGRMADFLVDAVVRIKEHIPEFEFIAIGSGPEQKHFEKASARYPWFHYFSSRFGREKALYFKLADVFLMPGVMGLGILDAFVAGLPTVTTRTPNHGPEIGYLREGQNGLITSIDVQEYTSGVVRLLNDSSAIRKLRAEALSSGQDYSIEAMVENFRSGILECLGIGAISLSKQVENAEGDLSCSRTASGSRYLTRGKSL